MYIYYIFVIISLFFIYREQKYCVTEQEKLRNFKWFLVPVFTILAFKGITVGRDTPGYCREFTVIGQSGFFEYERIEKGFVLLLKLLRKITNNPQILFVVLALLIVVVIYCFFKKNAKSYCLAAFLFLCLGFFQFALTGVRQAFAICILLFSYEYIKKRKIYHFFACVLVAYFFHKSSLFFVPFYFVANAKLLKNNILYLIVGLAAIYYLTESLLITAADIMDYDYGIEETENGLVFFSVVCLISLLAYFRRDRLLEQNPSNLPAMNGNFLSLSLWTMRLISLTAERVALFFLPYTALVLEEWLMTNKSKKKELVLIVLSLATILFLHRINQHSDLNEYKFCFEIEQSIFKNLINY